MIPKSGNKNIDNVVVIGVIVLIVYVVYKLLKTISNPVTAVQELLEIEPDTDILNPDTIVVDYTKTNYSKTQFELWADVLEDSLYYFIGENEQPIKDIMYQINNDEDLKAIIKAYGIRTTLSGLQGGNLVTSLYQFTPELIAGFNDHYAGWNMRLKL